MRAPSSWEMEPPDIWSRAFQGSFTKPSSLVTVAPFPCFREANAETGPSGSPQEGMQAWAGLGTGAPATYVWEAVPPASWRISSTARTEPRNTFQAEVPRSKR